MRSVAGPIRFRHATSAWDSQRVDRDLLGPLASKFGAERTGPWYAEPSGHTACRLEMDNGDLALFTWATDKSGAYWLGNTETPESLWRTDKYTFEEIPYSVARWAQRELLATLEQSDPWLGAYEHVTWFFLPVFFSKDGRETTREFFREHAAGFPDASRQEGLEFYESALSTGVLDDYRYTMASKLGTSARLEPVQMRATMGEINAAKLLHDAGYSFVPEIELESGYALDFQVEKSGTLVEVTRPEPPGRRRAGTPVEAVKQTVEGKTRTQLDTHEDAVLFVDCTSFRDDEWATIAAQRPAVGHEPVFVYRVRPTGDVAGYSRGKTVLSLRQIPD